MMLTLSGVLFRYLGSGNINHFPSTKDQNYWPHYKSDVHKFLKSVSFKHGQSSQDISKL
jgi:hypothetical protein